MMVLPQSAKQSSILDFFKGKNGSTTPAPTVATEGGKVSSSPNENQPNNSNNKRPLGVEEAVEKAKVKAEPVVVDINFLKDGLLDICLDCPATTATADDDTIMEENKENSNSSVSNTNYIFSTFRAIIRSVMSDAHYANLFNETDWSVIEDFTSLPGQMQMLYIKLYMRKRAWITLNSIKYPEIDANCNHKSDLIMLTTNGFLLNSSKFESIEETLNLMSLPDMKTFIKSYQGFKFAGSKSKTIPLFLNYIRTSRVLGNDPTKTMESAVLERLKKFFANKCFRINPDKSNVFDRIFLIYYCPGYLLERIGKQNDFQWIFGEYNVSDESYPVQKTNKKQIVYSSREEFIEFVSAFNLVSQIIIQLNSKDFDRIVTDHLPRATTLFAASSQQWQAKDSELELFLRKYTPAGMYLRAIHECLTALEKLRKYQEYVDLVLNTLLSQTIYGHNFRGHWCVRAALICHSHLKNNDLAIEVCRIGLEDYFIRGGNRLELFNRLLKMVKIEKEDEPYFEKVCPDYYCLQYNEKVIHAEHRSITNDSSFKNFFSVTLANGEVSIMSVENIVINHYLNKGYSKGIHCESSIYHTLLGLFFWDIIYSVDDDFASDSFRYYKQISPLDLNYESFYVKRKEVIDARLLQISNFTEEELITEMTFSWHNHHGKTSFLINWEQISLEEVIEIATCLAADKIALICHFLIYDFKSLHKGFPDLIVWNQEKKKIKLIEVKSHTDHISPTQAIWLSYLNKFGIDVELCHVKPQKKS